MDAAKVILAKQLADLFGFEDGVEDVLEMLLSIESKEDLKVYLDQLLGVDKDTWPFIEDVERVQHGVMPANVASTALLQPKRQTEEKSIKPKTQESNSAAISCKPVKQVAPQTCKQAPKPLKGKSGGTNVWQKTQQQQQKTGKKKGKAGASSNPQPALPSVGKASPESQLSSLTKKTNETPTPAAPKRGTPTVVCGCFGNLHTALANCLYCGRISCEREGYSYCGFCGYMVEKVEGDSDDAAWKHKERLLRYDRESAQRTVIIDDQSDYYTSSAWLSATEEEEAEAAGQARYDEMHRRGRTMKLNIG